MKKIFLLAVVFILASPAAFSQVSYGVKGGLNLANWTDNEGESSDMKPSVYVGGFAEFKLGNFFGLSPELLYSRQGFQMEEEGVKMRLRANYINVPVLAKFYVTNGLSIDIGPQIGFLLDSDVWLKSGGETYTLDLPNDEFGVELNTVDVSFAMGVTYNFNKLFVQGRYNLGMTKVAKNPDYDDFDYEVKSRNSVIQIGVGYRF